MQSVHLSYNKDQHFKTSQNHELIFNHSAVEITILDNHGRIVWRKRREQHLDPIRWSGLTLYGEPAGSGSYTCKIVYAGRQVVYIPFIFISR